MNKSIHLKVIRKFELFLTCSKFKKLIKRKEWKTGLIKLYLHYNDELKNGKKLEDGIHGWMIL